MKILLWFILMIYSFIVKLKNSIWFIFVRYLNAFGQLSLKLNVGNANLLNPAFCIWGITFRMVKCPLILVKRMLFLHGPYLKMLKKYSSSSVWQTIIILLSHNLRRLPHLLLHFFRKIPHLNGGLLSNKPLKL